MTEVVQLAGEHRLPAVGRQMQEELLGQIRAFRELPDHPHSHHVLAAPCPASRPLSAGTKKMSSATVSLSACAVRYAEIEFKIYEVCRAFSAWLFDAASQLRIGARCPQTRCGRR